VIADSGGQIRVLIVDDHPVFRAGLRTALSAEAGIVVVGEAETGAAAITLTAELAPDVVLMDVSMPGMDGLSATKQIVSGGSVAAVLVLTMFENDDSVLAAMRAGARGYLIKGATADRIAEAVRTVAAGELVFGSGIAARVLGLFATRGRSEPGAGTFPNLTDRELEILDRIAAGRSNPQIATELFLSEKTVRNNVSNIFSKMQVTDRAEAIVRAREAGMG
jgi:DNA-binding NarL/FixJ family response regulator